MEDRSIKHDDERTWRVWPFAATLAVVIGVALVNDTLSSIRGGDAASYVLLAKAIATGHGLADINIPGAPAHTQYPPILPLLLSPIYKAFGYNFAMMRLVMLFISYGAVYMAGRYIERVAGTRMATAVAFLMATNFYYHFYARELMTEVPYAMFSLLALYLIKKFAERGGVREYVIILPAVVALTYMTRMIGVTLYAAVIVAIALEAFEHRADTELRRRAIRRLVIFGVAAIVPFVAWSVRNSMSAADAGNYLSIFARSDYYSVDAGAAGAGALIERFLHNSAYYIEAIPRVVLSPPELKGDLPGAVFAIISIVTLLLVVVGLVTELWKRRGVKDYYFVIYFGLLTVWPTYGSGDATRYVIPMIPFVYYYLIIGVVWLVQAVGALAAKAETGFGRRALIPLCLILLAINLFDMRDVLWPPRFIERLATGGAHIRANLFRHIEGLTSDKAGADYFKAFAPCYSSYIYSSAYLGSIMGPGDVVMTRKAEITYLVSGRHAVRFPYTSDREAMDRFVKGSGVTYILIDACYVEAERYVVPYLMAAPDRYRMLTDDKKGTVILEILKDVEGGVVEDGHKGGEELVSDDPPIKMHHL